MDEEVERKELYELKYEKENIGGFRSERRSPQVNDLGIYYSEHRCSDTEYLPRSVKININY